MTRHPFKLIASAARSRRGLRSRASSACVEGYRTSRCNQTRRQVPCRVWRTRHWRFNSLGRSTAYVSPIEGARWQRLSLPREITPMWTSCVPELTRLPPHFSSHSLSDFAAISLVWADRAPHVSGESGPLQTGRGQAPISFDRRHKRQGNRVPVQHD